MFSPSARSFGASDVFNACAICAHASSALTRERLGWEPAHLGLLEDLEQGNYTREPVAYVCIERACVGHVVDPAALPAVMVAAEKQREDHARRANR